MPLKFESLKNATERFKKNIEVSKSFPDIHDENDDLAIAVRTGVIQSFEFTIELTYNFMVKWLKEFTKHDLSGIVTKNQVIRLSADENIISEPEKWIGFWKTRNLSSHTYDDEKGKRIYQEVIQFLEYAENLIKVLEDFYD